MTRRAAYHHGDLREALIAAAMELIAENGPAALSIAEAARRTGVSAAAPYRHFPSRQALLNAAAIRAATLLTADFQTAIDSAAIDSAPGDPVEQLAATAVAYVRFVVAHRAGFDLIFSAELQDLADEERLEAGRAVMATLLPIALQLTGSARDALDLLERHIAGAHGYATLFLAGFLKRRTTDVDEVAAQAAEVSRALACASRPPG